MGTFHILFLAVLPICLAQFSIQGPSDGNREAQGLKYSEDKGIEYSDQRESLGTGDFSIQGASDGNSDFHIQGASDGNSDFQIQGATDGNNDFHIQGATDGNSNFQIQGATDGNANFQIQGATDGNANYHIQGETNENPRYQTQEPVYDQAQSSIYQPYDGNSGRDRALQYTGPNGFKLNWKSYAHGQLSPQAQQPQQPESPIPSRPVQPAYASQAPAPQAPARRAEAPAPAPEEIQQQISYRPYDNAPAQIKQLLQFQSQIPYLNAIPSHLRYDSLAQSQPPAYPHRDQAQVPVEEPPQEPPKYRQRAPGRHRTRRQAQQHQSQQQGQPQKAAPQPQYRRIPAPAPEVGPNYSTNVPPHIQQLQQLLARIPYENGIPEQFRYNFDQDRAPVPTHSVPQRSKRQAPQSHSNPSQHTQYPTSLPPQIQQILQFQSQIPYQNAIPEQFRWSLDKVQRESPAQGNHQRGKRQAQQHQGQQQRQAAPQQQQYRRVSAPGPEVQPRYSTNAPAQIQQLLQFQSQIPYQNGIPEPFRYDLTKSPAPAPAQGNHQRGKREAQQHQGQQQRQAAPQQQQYRRVPAPGPEVQPRYSTNTPAQIQQLLQFQSQIPYQSGIPEPFRYDLTKSPAPAPAQGNHQRGKREAQQHQSQQQRQAAPQQQQYRKVPAPGPEVHPRYSTNAPAQIQQLLQFQAQIPYQNAIPEQFRYNVNQAPVQPFSSQGPQQQAHQ